LLNSSQLSQWEQQGAFLVAYENIGLTYRDFVVPLSSKLIGKSQNLNGATNRFQIYLYQRLLNWAQQTPTRPKSLARVKLTHH
jgi:hypothetical protein